MERVTRLVFSTVALVMIFMISFSAFPVIGAPKGPREEDLVIQFYPNVEEAYYALKVGDIDIIGYELTADLYEDAVNDANIVLAPVAYSGMYEFDINNNCTIHTYPGVRSPTNYQSFRQALAFLVDKDYIVEMICGGFAERIDQPIAAPHKGWRNESMWRPNYPYEYDPQAAADILDSAGFLQGSTSNPYYDASFSGSAEKIRMYPPGHSKAGENLDDLVVIIRSDDTRRYQAGTLLVNNMRKHGIPARIPSFNPMFPPRPWEDHDYHIYTGGWSLGGFPPGSLYGLFSFDNWFPDGSNYVTGVDCYGYPNYPELDQLLNDAVNALSHNEIVEKTKKALGYFTEQCITIPLWTTLDYWAYRSDLLGVVNMEGAGPENSYTFMNAYKTDGSAIHYGLKHPPNAMNILYSQWYYDYQCLDKMNIYSTPDKPPYDLSVDQSGFVKDWEINVWSDEGVNKTKVTKWFRSDSYFAEPVTGNQKANVNASHYFLSSWYIYQAPSSWWCYLTDPLHHIDIIDEYQVDIYFDTLSYLNLYESSGPTLPMDVWLQQPELAIQWTEIFIEGTNLTTPGLVELGDKPFWIESVIVEGAPLTMFSDYNIVGQGSCESGRLEIFADLPSGAVVVIDYWSVNDPRGYTPGELPWQTIFEGAGMYYATEFTSDFLTLKRNPHYWMETPLLGEVDFVRKPSGTYKIDIYDIVVAVSAYGSDGTGVPSSDWFPGADIAPPAGTVDIFDIVTIIAKYGREFDKPP